MYSRADVDGYSQEGIILSVSRSTVYHRLVLKIIEISSLSVNFEGGPVEALQTNLQIIS